MASTHRDDPGPRYFASVPRIQPHTDPALWPVSMRVSEVAVVTRQSATGLYRRVALGTAQPMPVLTPKGDAAKPLRWHRDTVRRFVEGRQP